MKKLVTVKDNEGLLRVHGRLKASEVFNVNCIHPIILPGEHAVTRLIVEGIHNSQLSSRLS